MKKIISLNKVIVLVALFLSVLSCEDFMSTESTRYLRSEDNKLTSANDTVYSVLGILAKVQQLMEKTVLVGELRADMMDVSEKTISDIRNLNNYNLDVNTSVYTNPKDYYAVINNCNYFIQKADTALTERGKNIFKRELNVVRTIRAWTYLQIGLNYGEAVYTTTPFLSVNDLEKDYPVLKAEELVDKLIAEILALDPVKNRAMIPNYGSIDAVRNNLMFIDPLFLLGDLYLWKASFTKSVADYELAANNYAELIKIGYSSYFIFEDTSHPLFYTVSSNAVKWQDEMMKGAWGDNWSYSLNDLRGLTELISVMKLSPSSYNGTLNTVDIMCKSMELKPSDVYRKLSDEQLYCYRSDNGQVIKYSQGDLRIKGTLRTSYSLTSGGMLNTNKETIYKFHANVFSIYRIGLLYLRYAEAVNRMGKPSMAFAVLKHGLNAATLSNAKIVSPGELTQPDAYYAIFKAELFNNTDPSHPVTQGIHSRGSGNSAYNVHYVIPDFTTSATARQDSIDFVESAICDELGLETTFEGNRFQDLMRISNHRNDPKFLAKKVAAKHQNQTDADRIFTLLSESKNWYLPMKK